MSVRIYELAGDIYLTGAGTTPCLRWYRDVDCWLTEPADLPKPAQSLSADQVPDDLREELLAFVVRAETMGGAMGPTQYGN